MTIQKTIQLIENFSTVNLDDKKKVIIFDRDGTLIENIPYLKDISQIKFKPEVVEYLKIAQDSGFEFVIATNQSGIGRGLVDLGEVVKVQEEIARQLEFNGVNLNQYVICPHRPIDNCICRKPKSFMISRILSTKNIDPKKVFLVGDMLTDVQAASREGVTSYLISDEEGLGYALPPKSSKVKSFKEAIQNILSVND